MRLEVVASITSKLDRIADRIQKEGMIEEANQIDVISNSLEKYAEKIPAGSDRPAPVFDDSDPNVTDNKDHYPIPDKTHARSALQRLSQFWDNVPSWWKGTLEAFRSKIISAVKSKFPKMKIDEEKFKEAAETDNNIVTAALSECESMQDFFEGYTINSSIDTSYREAAKKERAGAIFQGGSPNVNDGRDHFPITNIEQARNAIARAGQYSAAPKWYNGSLSSLKNTIRSAVHAKYPSIKLSK